MSGWSEKITANLPKILILADGELNYLARRPLFQYSDLSLTEAIREILLNICLNNLEISEGKK